jgi:cancer susceptibility candidate protein 1
MRTVLPVKERMKAIPFPDLTMNIVDNPVEIVFRLPERIYMSQDSTNVKIGVWDAEQKKWSIDYIAGECFLKPESRTINFTTTKFAPIAMLQSRCTDYPYANWWLRCIDPQTALLDLTTKRMKLIFEINPLFCKLVECEIPEL